MNAVLCLAVFAVALAVVTGENCRDVSDCNHVTCDAGHQLECHRSFGGGQCTCTTGNKCSTVGDCSGGCSRSWHCVDSICRCGFGIGK